MTEEESVLARLSISDVQRLGAEYPGLLATVSANLARNLSGRLRRANEQVRMLAH